ncbi:hypothetical protein BC567DRAFT_90953 [Phyllosticta citribraziliensis]
MRCASAVMRANRSDSHPTNCLFPPLLLLLYSAINLMPSICPFFNPSLLSSLHRMSCLLPFVLFLFYFPPFFFPSSRPALTTKRPNTKNPKLNRKIQTHKESHATSLASNPTQRTTPLSTCSPFDMARTASPPASCKCPARYFIRAMYSLRAKAAADRLIKRWTHARTLV